MKKAVFGLFLAAVSALAFSKGKPEKYVYLFDVVTKQPYKSVWHKDIWLQASKTRGLEMGWVKGAQGVSGPLENVTVGGTKYRRATLCEPHNCASNQMYILMNGKKAVALHIADEDRFIGKANAAEKNYLLRWRKADYEGLPF
ncbi:MAG: Ivy family c-type lysozyme inhibitor [Neisseria sp.]|nr:Ivy family c-type lysozyme inhibitor [Neisseria sp.]